jgi:vacuolar-type H+-ATPase subunit E/Vma4
MNGAGLSGLEPVVAALRAAAEAEASAVARAASVDAAGTLAAARERADGILAAAREAGGRDAHEALTAERVRVRRQARALVLGAHREAYEALRSGAREAVRRWGAEPGAHDALVRAATRTLGAGVRLREVPDGGLVAENGGRRLDLSLDVIAERTVEELR